MQCLCTTVVKLSSSGISSTAAAAAAMPGAALHQVTQDVDIMALVLQHVPEQQRLQCCALTCRRWRVAANQATTSISKQWRKPAASSQQPMALLVAWLQQYGGSVQHLQLAAYAANDPSIAVAMPQTHADVQPSAQWRANGIATGQRCRSTLDRQHCTQQFRQQLRQLQHALKPGAAGCVPYIAEARTLHHRC
jgi:hypothetical protein